MKFQEQDFNRMLIRPRILYGYAQLTYLSSRWVMIIILYTFLFWNVCEPCETEIRVWLNNSVQ